MTPEPHTGRIIKGGGSLLLRAAWALLAVLSLFTSQARADRESCLRAHESAQENRLRGHFVEAHGQLLVCAQRECPSLVSNDCTSWLAEVEAAMPSVVFAISDGLGNDIIDVHITQQGKLLAERADGRALFMDPGAHPLRFEAPGYAPASMMLSVRESEKRRIVRVSLEALPSGHPQAKATGARADQAVPRGSPRARRLLRASYGLAGVSVASLGVGVAFGIAGKRKLDRLEDGCGVSQECSERAVFVGQRRYVVADIAFGVAGAAAAAAIVTFVRGRHLRNESTRSLGCAPASAGITCSWLERF